MTCPTGRDLPTLRADHREHRLGGGAAPLRWVTWPPPGGRLARHCVGGPPRSRATRRTPSPDVPPAMAGAQRMTIEEVVRKVLREEHGDVIRESVRADRSGTHGGGGVRADRPPGGDAPGDHQRAAPRSSRRCSTTRAGSSSSRKCASSICAAPGITTTSRLGSASAGRRGLIVLLSRAGCEGGAGHASRGLLAARDLGHRRHAPGERRALLARDVLLALALAVLPVGLRLGRRRCVGPGASEVPIAGLASAVGCAAPGLLVWLPLTGRGAAQALG
jgi:hypothetical protein